MFSPAFSTMQINKINVPILWMRKLRPERLNESSKIPRLAVVAL